MDIPFADGLLAQWTQRQTRQRPVLPLAQLDLAQVRMVLLVLTTGLGDAVLSTPVFNAVRRALPKARIALFVRSAWAPLFAAESDIDEVIPYHGKWRKFFPTMTALRRFAPDLTLVLHGNDPDILPMTYLAGSHFILRVPTSGTRYSWLLSNRERVEDGTTVPGWHYIDNRLRILDSVGIPVTRRTPVIKPSAEALAQATAWRQQKIGEQGYWVLHPWAADSYKSWPEEQVKEFIAAASTRWPQQRIVLSGTAQDRPAAARLVAGLAAERYAIAAGELDIAAAAALLAGAHAVVAPDTGVLHLAAALNVPTVGLYAPTQTALVGPRAESAKVHALQQPLTCTPCLEKRCPYPSALCMAQFKATEVMGALANCLDKV